MPAEEVRYMRLLVFFDLPVKTKDDQREANRFRNFLLRTAMTGCSSRSMPAFAGARKMWRPISGGCKRTCRRTAVCACCR